MDLCRIQCKYDEIRQDVLRKAAKFSILSQIYARKRIERKKKQIALPAQNEWKEV